MSRKSRPSISLNGKVLQSALNGQSQEQTFESSGVVWVKFPAGTRGNSWKVWDRKFISVNSEIILQPDYVSTCAILLICRNEKSDSDIVFKKRLTSQNTIIFRSKSRTQPHSFTICVDEEPIIHLSSYSETNTQSWITCLREILWPPTPFAQLEKTLGSHFEISIIDNEFSFRAGLIGMYGYLQITSEKAVLTHPQSNSVVQEWLLPTVGFKLLPQSHPEDVNKVVTMITDTTSTTGYGTIVMFCTEAESLIRRVHSVRKMFVHKSYGEQLQEEMMSDTNVGKESQSTSTQPPPKPPRLSATIADGQAIESRKSLADPWLEKILSQAEQQDTIEDGVIAKAKTTLWNNMANISEIMLDSSINFKSGIRSGDNLEGFTNVLRESQSIEEEDDSYYECSHEIQSSESSQTDGTKLTATPDP